MFFIHQQIQSFLNLGVCKEYPIMARPKFPKNTSDVKETVSNTNSLPSLSDIRSDTSVGLAQVPPTSAGTEARETETVVSLIGSPSAADLNLVTKPKTGWLRSARFANATASRALSAHCPKTLLAAEPRPPIFRSNRPVEVENSGGKPDLQGPRFVQDCLRLSPRPQRRAFLQTSPHKPSPLLPERAVSEKIRWGRPTWH